jgi:hypothetical protein
MLDGMKAGFKRRGRFAVGGLTLAVSLWAGAPWVFCSETWAREAATECTSPVTSGGSAKPRSLRESAPPLAPFFL